MTFYTTAKKGGNDRNIYILNTCNVVHDLHNS